MKNPKEKKNLIQEFLFFLHEELMVNCYYDSVREVLVKSNNV